MKTRLLTRPLILSLLLATMLTLSGCGPIFAELMCGDQTQTRLDCTSQDMSKE